jgi:hypothetical protein
MYKNKVQNMSSSSFASYCLVPFTSKGISYLYGRATELELLSNNDDDDDDDDDDNNNTVRFKYTYMVVF